jgi:hypothetical protein
MIVRFLGAWFWALSLSVVELLVMVEPSKGRVTCESFFEALTQHSLIRAMYRDWIQASIYSLSFDVFGGLSSLQIRRRLALHNSPQVTAEQAHRPKTSR